MKFDSYKSILLKYYQQKGLESRFVEDHDYLQKAFMDINRLWLANLEQIKAVRHVLIAEAPMWGKQQKYIYNSLTKNSQFFYLSDLSHAIQSDIIDKAAFLKACNKIGLLIIDISPFALNPKSTAVNYRKMGKTEYKTLVTATFNNYFEQKVMLAEKIKSPHASVFFRYSRVKNSFHQLVGEVFVRRGWIKHLSEIDDISQVGGGIDRIKLKSLLHL